MSKPQWDNLVIDGSAAPPQLDEQQFREWMSHRRFFVSSVMDDEMTPFREAVRAWLDSVGSPPIMWEEITPRDERSDVAYLEGVNRSDGFLLLLGSRYGVTDQTGFSPTNKEANQAKDRGIPRLVFDYVGVTASGRDGRLNDWLQSLYAEVSTARFSDETDLIRKLDQRLREIASHQETPWLKLGPIVVPGTVRSHSDGLEKRFEVTIRTRDRQIQRLLSELSSYRSGVEIDRLTWGVVTYPVTVEDANEATLSTSVREYTIRLRQASGRGGNPMNVTVNDITPGEQVQLWSQRALFGESAIPRAYRDADYETRPEFEPLPQVLRRYSAHGWLAGGLARLYFVEGVSDKFEGTIENLEVGPATSSSVRIEADFHITTHEQDTVNIRGIVPIEGK
jgi:hypothetical protein